MMNKLRIISAAILTALSVSFSGDAVGAAAESSVAQQEASFSETTVSSDDFSTAYALNDGNDRNYSVAENGGRIELRNDGGIASLYIIFNRLPGTWTLTESVSGKTLECGENGYLHEFVDVKERLNTLPRDITLSFTGKTSIAEIYAFTEGALPDWVQIWEPCCEKADLMLISAHADDEHLFFAGTLPYYAGELGLNVQVVYATEHSEYIRSHERLDGLWLVGVRSYPYISGLPDLLTESLDDALAAYKYSGYEYDDILGIFVDTIRQFKPLVVLTHAVDGEYGHGTHRICSKALMDVPGVCGDASYRPESAEKYGVWQPEKVYIHSLPENPITLDWDIPLERFGGKTAFQMSQQGYLCHKSQLSFPDMKNWLCGKNSEKTLATQVMGYSPCKFGLYFSTVGEDANGGDFLENVKTYEMREAEQARLKAEEEARQRAEEEALRKAEEERQAAEEEARKKAEEEERLRIEEEERVHLAEERERAAEEARKIEEADKQRDLILKIILIILLIAIITFSVVASNRKKSKKRH